MAIAANAQLVARISADTSKFRRGMGEANSSMDRLKRAAGVTFAAAAASATYFAADSVRAFAEAEQSQAKLTDAYARFKKLGDFPIERLREYNAALQRKTRYDDDDIAASQARLAAFDLTGKQLRRITPLVLDYATATGSDLESSSTSIGKALLGNTRALKALGINYTSTGDAAKDYDAVLGLIQEKVGGKAFADAKTAAGQLDILRNQFGELKETVGSALVPVLGQFVDWANEAMPKFKAAVERNMPQIKQAFTTLGEAAENVGGIVKNAYDAFSSLPPGVQSSIVKLGGLAAALGLIKNSAVGTGIKVGVDVVGSLFRSFKTANVNAAVVNVNGIAGGKPDDLGGKKGKFKLPGVVKALPLAAVAAINAEELWNAKDSARLQARQAALLSGGSRMDSPTSSMRTAEEALKAEETYQSLTRASDAYTNSVSATNARIAEFAKGQEGVKEASRRNREQLSAQASAAKTLIDGLVGAKASSDEVSGAQQKARQQLFETAQQMSISKREARQLAEKLGLIKSKDVTVTTTYKTVGMPPIFDAIRDKNWLLPGIQSKARMLPRNVAGPSLTPRSVVIANGGVATYTEAKRPDSYPYAKRRPKVEVEVTLDSRALGRELSRNLTRARASEVVV